MLRFYAISFAVAYGNLERAEALIVILHPEAGRGPMPAEQVEKIKLAVADMETACKELPVSRSLLAQFERFRERLDTHNLRDDAQRLLALNLIHELKLNICNELASHLYLMVPVDRRNLFNQPEPLFRLEVNNRFPDATKDISDAGRCIALDQWTASIFHLMRVVEHGLRDLATRVGAVFPVPIELEQWKNIIDVIEKRIRDLEQQPKSQQKSEELQFYGKAASQFWYFKEAWRNHVSHSRATYDEGQALRVFNAVRDFMMLLASRP